MALLHVVPDERGTWRVFEDTRSEPLSEHWTATHAEFAALSHARDDQEVVVHDRYGRTRQPGDGVRQVVRGAPRLSRCGSAVRLT